MSVVETPVSKTAGSSLFDSFAMDLEHAGRFAPGTPGVYEGSAGSAGAGALVAFSFRLCDDRIVEVRYRFRGSPWINAACAYYAKLIEGQSPEASWPTGAEVARQLGYPRSCYDEALIVEDALMATRASLPERSHE